MSGTDGTPKKKEAFLAAYAETQMVSEACKITGIGRTTAYRWRQQDEQFALAWADAEERVTDILEAAAIRRAVSGSDTLLIFLLKSRKPAVYREKYEVQHSGKIAHDRADLSKLTDEQIAALEAIHADDSE